MLTRIEGRIEALPQARDQGDNGSPLSIKQAAHSVNLSQTHIRRAIAGGRLTASNLGSAARPLWRVQRGDLVRWMEANQGGQPKVPPRSDLKELIRRHLPGL